MFPPRRALYQDDLGSLGSVLRPLPSRRRHVLELGLKHRDAERSPENYDVLKLGAMDQVRGVLFADARVRSALGQS